MTPKEIIWEMALTDQSLRLALYGDELWLEAEHEDMGASACLLTWAQATELARAILNGARRDPR